MKKGLFLVAISILFVACTPKNSAFRYFDKGDIETNAVRNTKKADIIKNDSANNLIILRVNYPQLRQLGAHTSWCILSQGTFDSYNSICDQYMIYFTDKIGNESLIGSTIGKSVKTSHYVNDNSVDRSTLEKLLSEREFKISDLYMSESEYIKREFQKSTLGELVKKYGKDKVYTEVIQI